MTKETMKLLAHRYQNMTGNEHIKNLCSSLIENIEKWPVDKSGRWIGFIQGEVINQGLTSVEIERNYSRPLFHEAYEEDGLSIPETVSVL